MDTVRALVAQGMPPEVASAFVAGGITLKELLAAVGHPSVDADFAAAVDTVDGVPEGDLRMVLLAAVLGIHHTQRCADGLEYALRRLLAAIDAYDESAGFRRLDELAEATIDAQRILEVIAAGQTPGT